MSSRLFQEVRERRGLCYAIYSTAWGLKDTGLFAVHAATGAGMVGELIDVVSDEIDRMADSGPKDAEVARAKAQLKAGLMMSLESSSARAEQMARQMLLHGRVLLTSDILAAVDRVRRIRSQLSLAGCGARRFPWPLLALAERAMISRHVPASGSCGLVEDRQDTHPWPS